MITVNAQQFSADVSAWVAKARGRTQAFATEFIQDINEQVVLNTPVKTGFLRGSWFAQLNSVPGGSGEADTSGGASVARMNLVAADVVLGDVYYAANGANYAVHVEYGTSRMAPRAFVRSVIDRANGIAEAAAARVAEGK